MSEYNNSEVLHKFSSLIDLDDDAVYVDKDEIDAWARTNPQAYQRDEYQGLYADLHGTPEEPNNGYIRELAKNGLEKSRPPRQSLGHGRAAHPDAVLERHSDPDGTARAQSAA